MLVLSRKKDEQIIIGESVSVMVIDIRGDRVRLGISAPKDVQVDRKEIFESKQKDGEVDG